MREVKEDIEKTYTVSDMEKYLKLPTIRAHRMLKNMEKLGYAYREGKVLVTTEDKILRYMYLMLT